MKQSIRLGLSIATATLLFSSVGSAITIFQESFENPPNAPGLNVSPPRWQLVSGSVDVLDSVLNTTCGAPSGNNCLDIDGSNSAAGLIRSNRQNDGTTAGALSLFAGNTYTFSFYASGSGRNYLGVDPNNTNTFTWRIFDGASTFASGTVTLAYDAAWQQFSANLSGVSGSFTNARIEFDGGPGGDNVGLLIDDILLDCAGSTCAGTGTPEPATFALMGAGLALIGLRMRRS